MSASGQIQMSAFLRDAVSPERRSDGHGALHHERAGAGPPRRRPPRPRAQAQPEEGRRDDGPLGAPGPAALRRLRRPPWAGISETRSAQQPSAAGGPADTRRGARPRALRRLRYRRDCLGELVQIDGCQHAWFEDRAPKCTLLVYVDAATGGLMETSRAAIFVRAVASSWALSGATSSPSSVIPA